ncbi:MAG: SufE family protein [Fidelibacterota bacterium]
MSIESKLAAIREDFELFDDPRDIFIQIMDIGKQAPAFDPAHRVDKNRVPGCASQAWVVWQKSPDGNYQFQVDSDANIVKGLLTLLATVLSGERAEIIQKVDPREFLAALGLSDTITSQRTNGFISALEKVKAAIRKESE